MKLSSSKLSGITSALALFTNNLDVSGGKIHPFHLLYIFNVYKIRLITMHICHSIIDDGCRKSSKGDEDKCLATTHWTSSPLKYTCNKPHTAFSYNQTLNGWGVESYELTNTRKFPSNCWKATHLQKETSWLPGCCTCACTCATITTCACTSPSSTLAEKSTPGNCKDNYFLIILKIHLWQLLCGNLDDYLLLLVFLHLVNAGGGQPPLDNLSILTSLVIFRHSLRLVLPTSNSATSRLFSLPFLTETSAFTSWARTASTKLSASASVCLAFACLLIFCLKSSPSWSWITLDNSRSGILLQKLKQNWLLHEYSIHLLKHPAVNSSQESISKQKAAIKRVQFG